MKVNTLTPELLHNVDAYWRAASTERVLDAAASAGSAGEQE